MGGSGSVSRIHFLDGICSCIFCRLQGIVYPEAGVYLLSADEPDVCMIEFWHIVVGKGCMAGCEVCSPVGETQARLPHPPWYEIDPEHWSD